MSTQICDFHVHAFPDTVATRAIEALCIHDTSLAATDGTIAGTLTRMDQAGVSCCVIQPVATKPGQVRSINDWAAGHTDPRIISFGGIHPGYEDIPGEIDRIVTLGLPGIKVHPNWQGYFVDDPAMYKIYEAAEGRLIVLFHSGDEIAPYDVMRSTPQKIKRVHKDFPNLTIIVAHMGGYNVWDEAEEYLLGEDVYFDTSSCFEDVFSDERYRSMISRHGVEKILFATDMPYGDPLVDLPRFHRIGLKDEELELIFSGNAKRLLPGLIC